MDEATERQLVNGLRAGSADAWRGLHDACARRVWVSIARITGAREAEVADMVQETFLAAARSASGFDPARGRLWPWLWGIARRQAALYYRRSAPLEELRRAHHWWASLESDQRDLYARVVEDPVHLLEAKELAAIVRAALARLSAEHQMLLVAKYMDDESSARIATEMGMSPMAVDSALARARKALRAAMAEVTAFDTSDASRNETEVST